MSEHCTSCGVAFEDHLGLVGTCARLQILREALENLLVYTKHIKRRAGVQMNDPNTGSVLAAEAALQRAGGDK